MQSNGKVIPFKPKSTMRTRVRRATTDIFQALFYVSLSFNLLFLFILLVK